MTCIVGVECNSTVYIGGDSAGISEYDICTRVDEKIFIKDEFVMGFAGSFRMGQLLRYVLKIPKRKLKIDDDDMQYLVSDFMDAVRTCYREKGVLTKSDDVEAGAGQFMFGYRGKLYTVEEDFQVARVTENYYAIGCASSVALGAMYACQVDDPHVRITCALEAAAKFNAGVREPFKILGLSYK